MPAVNGQGDTQRQYRVLRSVAFLAFFDAGFLDFALLFAFFLAGIKSSLSDDSFKRRI